MNRNIIQKPFRILIPFCISVLLLITGMGARMEPWDGPYPPRPTPVFPPRPEPIFPPRPEPRPGPPLQLPDPSPEEQERGAYIDLEVENGNINMWTVVEWADLEGNWYPVIGWRGELEPDDHKVWWVAPEDFNTGPFRWRVYESRNGSLLASSEPFYLPAKAGWICEVYIFLAP